jgi:hypothetical protein
MIQPMQAEPRGPRRRSSDARAYAAPRESPPAAAPRACARGATRRHRARAPVSPARPDRAWPRARHDPHAPGPRGERPLVCPGASRDTASSVRGYHQPASATREPAASLQGFAELLCAKATWRHADTAARVAAMGVAGARDLAALPGPGRIVGSIAISSWRAGTGIALAGFPGQAHLLRAGSTDRRADPTARVTAERLPPTDGVAARATTLALLVDHVFTVGGAPMMHDDGAETKRSNIQDLDHHERLLV